VLRTGMQYDEAVRKFSVVPHVLGAS